MREGSANRPQGKGPSGRDGAKRPQVVPFPEDRMPPHSSEAEKSVLGAILFPGQDPEKARELFAKVREVLPSPDAFFVKDHETIYRTMIALDDDGKPVDMIMVDHQLQQGRDVFDAVIPLEYLGELSQSVPHAVNAVFHAGIVADHFRRRTLVESQRELLEQGYGTLESTDDLAAKFLSRVEQIVSSASEDEESKIRRWPKHPGANAWHGLAGDFVEFVDPHTEADPVAVLMQFLVTFGNIIGRGPHWRMGTERHGLNLFTCIVGNSSQAKKGTSWNAAREIFYRVDPDYTQTRIMSGMTSGEGMVDQIRDAVRKGSVTTDEGVDDKRALWIESEFGSTLSVMAREGNNLSGIVRQAWDGGMMGCRSKKSPTIALLSHVSIIGHVTGSDLDRNLSTNEAANGFANRFLWVCARRSKMLPEPSIIPHAEWNELVLYLHKAIEYATEEEVCLVRTPAAKDLWAEHYPSLTADRPGLLGATMSRGAPQVMRLACIYALLDRTVHVDVKHLLAALELWNYCVQSAAYIFGNSLGNDDAERLLVAIQAAGMDGMNRRRIAIEVFRNHKTAGQINIVLETLYRSGLIESREQRGTGRPSQVWVSTQELAYKAYKPKG